MDLNRLAFSVLTTAQLRERLQERRMRAEQRRVDQQQSISNNLATPSSQLAPRSHPGVGETSAAQRTLDMARSDLIASFSNFPDLRPTEAMQTRSQDSVTVSDRTIDTGRPRWTYSSSAVHDRRREEQAARIARYRQIYGQQIPSSVSERVGPSTQHTQASPQYVSYGLPEVELQNRVGASFSETEARYQRGQAEESNVDETRISTTPVARPTSSMTRRELEQLPLDEQLRLRRANLELSVSPRARALPPRGEGLRAVQEQLRVASEQHQVANERLRTAEEQYREATARLRQLNHQGHLAQRRRGAFSSSGSDVQSVPTSIENQAYFESTQLPDTLPNPKVQMSVIRRMRAELRLRGKFIDAALNVQALRAAARKRSGEQHNEPPSTPVTYSFTHREPEVVDFHGLDRDDTPYNGPSSASGLDEILDSFTFARREMAAARFGQRASEPSPFYLS